MKQLDLLLPNVNKLLKFLKASSLDEQSLLAGDLILLEPCCSGFFNRLQPGEKGVNHVSI